jgi:diadenosine tetraphosphate (Ap4A) HIT family hydrolase
MNATLRKFGYPAGLVREYRHWAVLLRPAQVTLGALVLAALSEATAFSALPAAAFSELHRVTQDIELGLAQFKPYDRINYLMLMMVDPHVHFHVLPRYAVSPHFDGMTFTDAGWPGPPDLKHTVALSDAQFTSLRDGLRACCSMS